MLTPEPAAARYRLTRSSKWLDTNPRSHWVAALIFALTVFAYFAPALVGGRVFTDTAVQQGYVFPWAAAGTKYPFALQSDQADLSMPALQVQRRAYLSGDLPVHRSV